MYTASSPLCVVVAADFLGKLKSIFLDIATSIIMVYIGLNAIIDNMFTTYLLIVGLSILAVGVALSVISCVNYTISCMPVVLGKNVKNETSEEK